MKIAILSVTRGIGLELVKAALADGHEVTGLARSPGRMPLRDPRLRLLTGDAADPDAVAETVEGQEVVCVCLGTKQMMQKVRLFSRSAENLANALRPEQLLITVTGIGAGDTRGHGGFFYHRVYLPLVLRWMYDDKDRQEAIIRERIARWIVVRPGFFTNGARTGRYRALIDLRGIRGGKMSRADVADFMLSQAKEPRFLGKTPLLIY